MEIVGPLSLGFVLLPLHDGKAIKEKEKRNDDAVYEAGCAGLWWTFW